jgi:cobalt-zinc-cadmium efflux system outer membrane protein
MTFHRSTLFGPVALLLGYSAACGETLEHITAEALRNNPELRVFEQSVAAAKGGVRTARTWSNPELTIQPGFRRTKETDGTLDEFHGVFSLSQLFKFPGKRALEIAIAQGNVELNQIALEGFRYQVATKVRRAFYDLLTSQKIVQSRREQVESAKAFVELARKRAEAGYASDFETVKSQADLISASGALLQAEGHVAGARVTLNALMGRSPTTPLEISGALDKLQTRGTRGDFLALAMARNPAIRTQWRQAEIAGLTLRSTRFGRRPDFAIGPSVEYLRNEQTYDISATVALPLWDQKNGEIQTATAEQKKAFASLEKTRLEIAVEKGQLELYTPAFLDRLKALMAQAEQGYAQNATTLLIYLDAKRTYFDTLVNYDEALGNLAENRAELESAIGVPLELKP